MARHCRRCTNAILMSSPAPLPDLTYLYMLSVELGDIAQYCDRGSPEDLAYEKAKQDYLDAVFMGEDEEG